MGRRDLQAVNKLEGAAAPLYAESMRSSKHVFFDRLSDESS